MVFILLVHVCPFPPDEGLWLISPSVPSARRGARPVDKLNVCKMNGGTDILIWGSYVPLRCSPHLIRLDLCHCLVTVSQRFLFSGINVSTCDPICPVMDFSVFCLGTRNGHTFPYPECLTSFILTALSSPDNSWGPWQIGQPEGRIGPSSFPSNPRP